MEYGNYLSQQEHADQDNAYGLTRNHIKANCDRTADDTAGDDLHGKCGILDKRSIRTGTPEKIQSFGGNDLLSFRR